MSAASASRSARFVTAATRGGGATGATGSGAALVGTGAGVFSACGAIAAAPEADS